MPPTRRCGAVTSSRPRAAAGGTHAGAPVGTQAGRWGGEMLGEGPTARTRPSAPWFLKRLQILRPRGGSRRAWEGAKELIKRTLARNAQG